MENFKTLGLMTTFMVSILRYNFKKVASVLFKVYISFLLHVFLLYACCSILYKLKSRLKCDLTIQSYFVSYVQIGRYFIFLPKYSVKI